ncbi:hypothetical protein, partial [Enterobacter hormaechei]|uniref:hypothetical protein n=1 Tax=Enterobacter hormaechei TaxID=158836 RepID=UPI003C75CBD1
HNPLRGRFTRNLIYSTKPLSVSNANSAGKTTAWFRPFLNSFAVRSMATSVGLLTSPQHALTPGKATSETVKIQKATRNK